MNIEGNRGGGNTREHWRERRRNGWIACVTDTTDNIASANSLIKAGLTCSTRQSCRGPSRTRSIGGSGFSPSYFSLHDLDARGTPPHIRTAFNGTQEALHVRSNWTKFSD
jgi:hypothetical protein